MCLTTLPYRKLAGVCNRLGRWQVLHSRKKLDKLKNAEKSISALEKLPVRALGSVVGQIMPMGPALGPITQLRTRALYAVINSSTSWSD